MSRRSGEGQAALGRKAGPMRHRLEPRGGARNDQPEYMEEHMAENDEGEGFLDVSKVEEHLSRSFDLDKEAGVVTAGGQCTIPPPGWWCSRGPGHEGPCAARPLCEHDAHVFAHPHSIPCPCVLPSGPCPGVLVFEGSNIHNALLGCDTCKCGYKARNVRNG